MQALHYIKFLLFHMIGAFVVVALFAGGSAPRLGLWAVVAFVVVGDAIAGDDLTTPRLAHPWLLTLLLWLALPLLGLIVFASVWSICPGDPLGVGQWLGELTGHDVLAARAATSIPEHAAGAVLTMLMIGTIGTIPGHELTHRTRDATSMLVGRWMLAFSLDTVFAIEHVYGHHRHVGTRRDPATAPRGRGVYAHIVLSTLGSHASGWHIEAERLQRLGLRTWSLHNQVLRGHAMSVVLLGLAYAMGGGLALGYFLACAAGAKALLEIVNYMEHYGLVRIPGTPVHPRHSWNTNRRISSWALFNLTRHSHHHANAGARYPDLKPYPDAPLMISGYLSTILLTLVPPLWRRLMAPRLAAWDRDYATEDERRAAAGATY